MKKIVLSITAIILIFGMVGCSQSASANIIGIWELSTDQDSYMEFFKDGSVVSTQKDGSTAEYGYSVEGNIVTLLDQNGDPLLNYTMDENELFSDNGVLLIKRK